MGRNRLGRLAVGIAIAAVACNGSTSAAPTPSPSPTAAAASPSPSPSPAPSPSPTEVLPANDVEDPVAALEAIVAYYDYLFENPRPEALSLVYAERCPCFEAAAGALSDMAANGERFVFSRPRSFEVVEVEEQEDRFAQILYREDSPAVELIDRRGKLLETGADEPEMVEVRVLLVREGSRWVVVSYA